MIAWWFRGVGCVQVAFIEQRHCLEFLQGIGRLVGFGGDALARHVTPHSPFCLVMEF